MPKIQCTTTYNGVQMTLYGTCPRFQPGDHNAATLDAVQVGMVTVAGESLTAENYDALCEILSLNAELQPD